MCVQNFYTVYTQLSTEQVNNYKSIFLTKQSTLDVEMHL